MQMRCVWIHKPAKPGEPAIFCNKPTSFTMVRDDDENLVRKYDSLCSEHRKKEDETTDTDT